MTRFPHLTSILLIGLGVAGFSLMAARLDRIEEIDVPLNVLGIKRSPYGEVIAMAIQGPIDSYWGVVEGRDQIKKKHSDYSRSEYLKSGRQPVTYEHKGLNESMRLLIEGLAEGREERTNPTAASDAHRFYLRRQVENKLRFAYELDPAHYGNFIAYHFFLTEPMLGTRPELTPHAAKLAQDTIDYCMKRRVDPREALTAAAAAGNVLELMLNDRFHTENGVSRYPTSQMRGVLQVMDAAIALHLKLSEEWLNKRLWHNLSNHRIQEVSDRLQFVKKVREAHEISIQAVEKSLK